MANDAKIIIAGYPVLSGMATIIRKKDPKAKRTFEIKFKNGLEFFWFS